MTTKKFAIEWIVAAVLTLLISGCVNSAQVKKRFDLDRSRPVGVEVASVTSTAALPPNFTERFRKYLDGALTSRDLAAPGRAATHALEVEFTEARFYGLVRVVWQKDRVVSTVRLRDKATGAVVGEATVESGSPSIFQDLAFSQAKAIGRLLIGKTSDPMRRKEASR